MVCVAFSLVALAAGAAAAPIKVSCVGDSITAEGGDMTYSLQLGRLLGPAYAVSNRGKSGHTMLSTGLCGAGPGGSWRHPCLPNKDIPQCSGDCSYWGTDMMNATIADQPDIVTIMLGTNDAKGCNWFGDPNGSPSGAGTQFKADYLRMIKLFQALPSKPKVFVALPPPGISQCHATGPAGNASVILAYNMSFQAINEVYPVLQREIAKEAGVSVIDVWGALNGTECAACTPDTCAGEFAPPCPHTADGIHPYPDSLGDMAKAIAAAIRE